MISDYRAELQRNRARRAPYDRRVGVALLCVLFVEWVLSHIR